MGRSTRLSTDFATGRGEITATSGPVPYLRRSPYYVNNTAGVVTEAANGGFDSVQARQLGAVHEWFRAYRN
jgi:hypothetical protein